MKLANYSSFEDKKQSVHGKWKVVKTGDIDEMFKFFHYVVDKKGGNGEIHRGVNEAAYKMYTSSQREWANDCSDTCYIDFLTFKLDEIKKWNNGLLQEYLTYYNRNFGGNDIAYFSIMQHYGGIAPLLDFTENPFCALFFASKDADKCYFDDNLDDIRNFFSIYSIEWRQYAEYTKNLTDLTLVDFSTDNVYNIGIDVVNNNLNIIAQKGVFFLNTSSTLDLISVLKKNEPDKRFFYCYNIHKSLAAKVRKKLKEEEGITKKTLFPNFSDFFDNAD